MAVMPLEPGRFFLPGPTEVHPDVLAAQARPVIGHRGPAIETLMERLQAGLRPLFGTERPVFVATSSATGLMEAAIRNGPTGRMLALVNGAFSERFVEIAEECGREVDRMDVPWGEVHDPVEVEAWVAERGYAIVTLVHSETSTGALQPASSLAAAVRRAAPETVVVVDSVTGIGGEPFFMDRWDIDFVVTGSQKALALPPGLAFAAASERYMAHAGDAPARGFYFDLERFRNSLAKNQTPTTPAVTLLYALEAQLDRIEGEGLGERFARHREMAGRCAVRIGEMVDGGLAVGILAPAGARSPTVTCVTLPEGRRGPEVVTACRERGWVIGGGYGKLKETHVRIGHMGDHTVAALDGVMDVVEEALRS